MKKIISMLLVLAMIFAMLPAQTLAEVPTGTDALVLNADGDWLKTTQTIDHTKDFEIGMDIDFAKVNAESANDSWPDRMLIHIMNSATNYQLEVELQTYRNGGGEYQVAVAPQYNDGSGWKSRAFTWSLANYVNPTKQVKFVLKYNATSNEYTWSMTDRASGTALNIGTYPSSNLPEGLVGGTACGIEIYKDDANTTVTNAYIKTIFGEEGPIPEGADEITLNADGDWLKTTQTIDHTKDFEIGMDIDFAKISAESANDSWPDRMLIHIMNSATNYQLEVELQTYRNGGGEYQVAVAPQYNDGSGWKSRAFTWSLANYANPTKQVKLVLKYNAASNEYTWSMTDRASGTALNTGTYPSANLPEGLVGGTACGIEIYKDDANTTVTNAYILADKDESSIPEGADEITLNADGDWLKTTQKIDHTKDFEIGMDIDFAKVNAESANDSWPDRMLIHIMNSATNYQLEVELQTYRNGGGEYQVAVAPQYNDGSGWKSRAFTWSLANYANPTKQVKLVLKYNATSNEYTWSMTDRASGTALNTGTYPSASLPEGLVGGTACGIEIYKDDANTTVTNAYILTSKETASIDEANLTLGSDLTLTYFATIPQAESTDTPVLKVTRAEATTEIKGVYNGETKKWAFAYTGINPQCMTDPIDADLYFNDEKLAENKGYTVKAYCETAYATADAELKTLLADLLTYGAAAQAVTSYRTTDLANTPAWVAAEKTTFDAASVVNAKAATNSLDANKKIASAWLQLNNATQIYFKVVSDTTENIKLVFYSSEDGTSYKKTCEHALSEFSNAEGYYKVTDEPISAGDIAKIIKVELCNNTDVIQTVTYSVDSYVKYAAADETYGNLVKALHNYGLSAAAYVK